MLIFCIFLLVCAGKNSYLCRVETIVMTTCKSIHISELYCIERIQAINAMQNAQLQQIEAQR